MNKLLQIIILLSVLSCNENVSNIRDKSEAAKSLKIPDLKSKSNPSFYAYGNRYVLSITHKPFIVTGYFNSDNILDSAILLRNKITGQDVLLIKHGKNSESCLLKQGKDLGGKFQNFNWVGQFEVVKKGTKIWNNVINGEIAGEDQIPEKKKIKLKTDAIFIHEDEGGGGGIIYLKDKKYVWVQQD